MKIVNKNGRNFIVINCRICDKELYIYKSHYARHGKRCTSCATAEKNRNNKGKYHYIHNENYFSEQTLQSVYWAGFIAADGYIDDKGTIAINISQKDVERLEQFIIDIGYNNKVMRSGNTNNKRVIIRSHKLYADLQQMYNITPRKSITMIPPALTDRNMQLAFIIGYIDGDGTIGYTGGTFRLGAIGTLPYLQWMKSIIDYEIKPTKATNLSQRKNCPSLYEYTAYGKRGKQIYQMLKAVPVSKLQRKWSIE